MGTNSPNLLNSCIVPTTHEIAMATAAGPVPTVMAPFPKKANSSASAAGVDSTPRKRVTASSSWGLVR